MTVEDFSALDLARFEFRLGACEPVTLPPFLGSTLRGAFGHALKEALCVVDHGECPRCSVAQHCVYPYLFETPVPPGIAQLRGQRQAPLPFIIEPPVVMNPVKRVWRLPAASAREATAAVATATAGQNGGAAGRRLTIGECFSDRDNRSLAFEDAVCAADQVHSVSQDVSSLRRGIGSELSSVTSIVFPDQPKRFNAGEELSFGLTLLGRAIDFLPYVVFAIAEMARRGLGANRAAFELKEVRLKGEANTREVIYSSVGGRLTVPPNVSRSLGELISERLLAFHAKEDADSEEECISRSTTESSRHCSSASRTLEEAIAERLSELRGAIMDAPLPDTHGSRNGELIEQAIESGRQRENDRHRNDGQYTNSDHRLKIRFLTPARIRVRGDLQTGMSFELLIRNLLRRVSILSAVHGRGHVELDYRGLVDRAAAVRTRRSRLRWWDLERYSNRQDEKLKMGGLIGEIEYEGEGIESYWALLVAGELLQVGSGSGYGLGRYRLMRA